MELKLFPTHSGIWEGTYKRIDAMGNTMFEHTSKLTMILNGKDWFQTNYYTFEDGREEFHNFGHAYFDDNGVMLFDNPRIYGHAWEDKENILLRWTYKDQPGSLLREMISLIDEDHRMRVWQHTQDGKFLGLTMIEEWKKAGQETIPMSHYDQKSYIKEAIS
jgi:hypothetical protein